MKKALLGLFILAACSTKTIPKPVEKAPEQSRDKRIFQIDKAWVRSTPEVINEKYKKINRMTPIMAGNLLIQGNGLDGVVAYDRSSGSEVWRVIVPNGVEGGAAVIKDRLFFGGNDGNFYSVSLKDGKILWTYTAKAENLSAPSLDAENGYVFFLSGNNVLYALEADSGKQLWTYSRQDTNNFSVRGGTKPAIRGNLVYAGFSEGSLIAFNIRSGSPVWELHLNKNKKFKDIDAAPVIDGNLLYVSGYDDRLYCIDAQKGEVLWKIDGGGFYGVTIDGDRIYYPTSQGEVWALKKKDGSKIWSYKLDDGVPTGIQIYKGTVVFGESQGDLVFLDSNTGKKIGEFEPGLGILSTPSVDDRRVYFISGDANLYAMEANWKNKPAFEYLR